jgi:hypothetical protein
MSTEAAVPRTELVNKLTSLLKTGDSEFKWVSNDKMQIKMPIKGYSVKHNGPIDAKFLKDNKMNILHYNEGVRRVVIVYQYRVGDKTEPNARYVKYGATVFRKTNGETFDKRGHTWTAISRLQTCPVTCKLTFTNIKQFKADIRRMLFNKNKYGVRGTHHGKKMEKFVIDVGNVNELTMKTLPAPEKEVPVLDASVHVPSTE